MARHTSIIRHKTGKRIFRMQSTVGVGDLQGSFYSVSVRRGLSSRHQKAAHWPRCWNELTSKVAINQTVMPPYATTPSPKIPSAILWAMRALGEVGAARETLAHRGLRVQASLRCLAVSALAAFKFAGFSIVRPGFEETIQLKQKRMLNFISVVKRAVSCRSRARFDSELYQNQVK